MTDADKNRPSAALMPSTFMRGYRPEIYSDSLDRTTIQLDAATLEYHLDTITARNQTHEFEIFCRKLCQRTICPKLIPASGPEGGGDSKADTESLPIDEEIASLTYVGIANHGSEDWAFAFSAKKNWAPKVRSDVEGIVATGRPYKRIYCVTSRFARARDRSRVQDELTKKHGIPVRILDRAWIVEEIIDHDRKDIAHHYLRIGREVTSPRLGPSDYSRQQQLEDLEAAIGDPTAYMGMKSQLATDALVAAKLSRALERPRVETDGRFQRAIRLSDADGLYRQRLMARYEHIWTSFWWFDDIAMLNDSYESFETFATQTDHMANVQLLCNVMQVVFTSVIHGHLTADAARMHARADRLYALLMRMASDASRPNNALAAKTSLLSLKANLGFLKRDPKAIAALWPQFSEVLDTARGLGEFDAESLVKMVQVLGPLAGPDTGYAKLVDQLAGFVAERKSEGEGALVLLDRARQLEPDRHFEIIRLLGRAAVGLTKKEYVESLIEAQKLLALAYRSAGLLWSARASTIFALTSTFIEAEENGHVPAHVIGLLRLSSYTALELWHLPELLEALRLFRGCVSGLPLEEESKSRATEHYRDLDMRLAARIVTLKDAELSEMTAFPDVLSGLDLEMSRTALLYVLGYEAELRSEETVPANDSSELLLTVFTKLANQAREAYSPRGPIFHHGREETFVAKVLGMQVRIRYPGSETCASVAEALAGTIECVLATALEHGIHPHTEVFDVTIQEDEALDEPRTEVTPKSLSAKVIWPAGRPPALVPQRRQAHAALLDFAALMLGTTCFVENPNETLKKLINDDVVLDRLSMIVNTGNSRQRLTGHHVALLAEWIALSKTSYPIRSPRPLIQPRPSERANPQTRNPFTTVGGRPDFAQIDHRQVEVRSLIDVHLWNEAVWQGVAFEYWPGWPPFVALMYGNGEAGKAIFQRWRDRFGSEDQDDTIHFAIVRGIDPENAHHYRALVTSKWSPADLDDEKLVSMTGRILTVPASTGRNLEGALDAFRQVGAYVLVPATLSGGVPTFHRELGILKRTWVVKNAADVGPHHPEWMALGHEADRARG